MEEVARNVNEGRRRAEVVKEVLSSAKKKPVVNVSVNVTRMKSLRHKPGGGGQDVNGEAAQVERMQGELKRAELFAQQFAKDIVDWTKSMSAVVRTLRVWAMSFGKVIGLSPEQGVRRLMRLWLSSTSSSCRCVVSSRKRLRGV